MGRSWSASLLIGAMVSGLLLAGYHFTSIFIRAAVEMEGFFLQAFVLPGEGDLWFSLPVQYGYFTVMAFLSAWVCLEQHRVFGKLVYMAGAVFLTVLLSPILAFCGVLFEPLSGAGAIVLAGLAGTFYGGTASIQRARRLQRYFVGRVSTEKFQQLVENKEAVDLCQRKELTVLNCSILNFPDLSSQMEAAELEKMGSFFLRAAAEFLVGRGAYLDNCNAQGLRVFFGLIEKGDDHAVEGCRAALELRLRLVNLEQEILSRWHRKAVFGVALSTGETSVGLFGFREFQFYSAVGEPVDFCRRLSGVNLVYGSQVLMGARTYLMTKDHMEARPMEMVYAPRMHHISEVYELLAEKGKLSEDEARARDEFWHGVVSLRKGTFGEALQHFKLAQMEGREDAPLKYFLERAEAGLKDSDAGKGKGTEGVAGHLRILTTN
ncbi:hypothetical protein FEM03_20150 [Phragmitibacter flavus]|uniref:Guanylate cyclase domain-containing protein n=1 Tax=Phragmitibacter flavus TaxID=2576071 RepID=A0A5R8KAN1_9BACT|nr:hypothetical protein [Phragmitibacter flavus]TLD68975.1 hypothetical protein FEM03_20150 [Phragmitibacter flavus]